MERDGFRLLAEAGYATVPRLLAHAPADSFRIGPFSVETRLLLTHLWPGTDPPTAVAAAAAEYEGQTAVAAQG